MAVCERLILNLRNRFCRWALLFAIFTAIALGIGSLGLRAVPLPSNLLQERGHYELLDRNGTSLRAVRPDGAPYRTHVTFEEIPRSLVNATLTAEDRRFFKHPGADWRGYVRAVWQLARYRKVVSGGSTLTQQLIKAAEPRPRNLRTKLIEAVKALRLEQVWSKEQILVEYLNRVEYGNATAGVGAATLFYFRKPLSDLSPAESAFLAALPQAPSRLNPHKHFARARKRQLWILDEMRALGYLSPEEHERAVAEPIKLARPSRPFQAPHFVDLLLRSGLLSSASPRVPGGARRGPNGYQTTIDLGLNTFAEKAIAAALVRLGHQRAQHAAAVVVDNRTSELLALVGSPDYYDANAGQVNGAWAPRSTGSTLKPFTYALAFERGFSPASMVADVPADFPTTTGVFSPVNFNRHCYGPVTCRIALANSLNIPAVRILNSLGGPAVLHHLLNELGLTSITSAPDFYGLGLAIGNAEARLLELANAYATLARLGEFRPLVFLKGQDVGAEAPQVKQVLGPETCYLIADILADNEARALAFSLESPLRFPFPVACKTGTSSSFRDNWAFGYTPEFTVGVWVGNFDNSPMDHVSGVTGAAPIMHEIVQHLHDTRGTSWYAQPASVTNVWIHRLTGKRLTGKGQPLPGEAVQEKAVVEHLPPVESPTDYAASGAVLLPAEYQRWSSSPDNTLGVRAVIGFTHSAPLNIEFPLPGTTFRLDPDLPDHGRIIYPRATARGPVAWRSPTLDCSVDHGRARVRLTVGRHILVANEQSTGTECQTWILVRGVSSAKVSSTAEATRSPALPRPNEPFASRGGI